MAMAAAAAAASKKPCRQGLAKGGDGREERGGRARAEVSSG